MSEEKLCVKVARDMGSKAYMEQDMGVELTDIDEGFAKVKMTIKKRAFKWSRNLSWWSNVYFS